MIYVRISRPGLGCYIQPLDQIQEAVEGEFDGVDEWAEIGDEIKFEFIEMSEKEYEELPEFEGW